MRVLALAAGAAAWMQWHTVCAAAFVISRGISVARPLAVLDRSVLGAQTSQRSSPSSIVVRQLAASSSEKALEDATAADDDILVPLPFADQQDVTMHTFLLPEHRPLGCTIEESLAPNDPYVFVSHLQEGGFAASAGLAVGDVIVGVTGLFGELEHVIAGVGGEEDADVVANAVRNGSSSRGNHHAKIDHIRSLITSRPDTEPLELRVARGTRTLTHHEAALTELCANPVDDDTEQCMLDYLKGTYYEDEDDESDSGKDILAAGEEELCDPEEDENCVLDSLHNMWAEDLPAPVKVSAEMDEETSTTAEPKQVKPWSSRHSPSGTWVRDPTTGEMRNIDS